MTKNEITYEVWYFDMRGAWRVLDECATFHQAKNLIKVEKLSQWKIIKVTKQLVEQNQP